MTFKEFSNLFSKLQPQVRKPCRFAQDATRIICDGQKENEMKDRYFINSVAKFSLSLAILLFFSLGTLAQNGATVSGRLTDAGVVMKNVEVRLISIFESEPELKTTTNEKGDYRFENVPNGNYSLVAKDSEGVEHKYPIRIRNGQSEIVSLELSPHKIIREQVFVVASSTLQNASEVSKSVSLVSGGEIQNRNEISIADALRTVPGLRVQQSGGFGRIATIKTRGLRNQDTAVLIDGQRFRDAAAITGDASPFLSDLTVTSVERIEVLRGSGSSLYGTNAIGGVFNVKTDNFTNDFRGNLLAEGGGLGQFRGRANVGGGIGDKAFYNLGVSHINFTNGVDGDDAARNTSGKAALQYSFSQYAQLTGRFYFADAFVQLNSNPDIIGTFPASTIVEARPLSDEELRRYENGTPINQLNLGEATFIPAPNDPDNNQASRFYNFNLALEGAVNNFANYRVSYQNLTTARFNRNGVGGVRPTSFTQPSGSNRRDFDGNIQTFQAKSDVVIRSNTLTAGYEFEREKYDEDIFALNSNQVNNFVDAVQTSNTVFVQNQLEAFDRRLQLSGALRAQFFNLKRPRLSTGSPFANLTLENPPTAYTADGSIAYFFRSTNTKLRGHVGNGYRVPSLFERFASGFFFGSNFFTSGNPFLEPERSLAVDAGIDQTFAANRVRLSGTYFYTRLIDTIGSDSNFDFINGSGGIARGAEFSAEFQPFTATNIFASYTYTNSDQLSPSPLLAGNGILRTLGVPEHQFTAVLTQRLFDRVTLNFDFLATGNYLAPVTNQRTFDIRIFRFDGNLRGDLTAAYEIPTNNDKLRVRLFGTIENLFNQDYYENGFRTARITGRGGLQLSF
jgi:vitamin B12 transporter